jgi:hypothetical protein
MRKKNTLQVLIRGKKEKSVLLNKHVTNWNERIDFLFFLGLKLVTSRSPSYELEMRWFFFPKFFLNHDLSSYGVGFNHFVMQQNMSNSNFKIQVWLSQNSVKRNTKWTRMKMFWAQKFHNLSRLTNFV